VENRRLTLSRSAYVKVVGIRSAVVEELATQSAELPKPRNRAVDDPDYAAVLSALQTRLQELKAE
jgi:ribonuclease D